MADEKTEPVKPAASNKDVIPDSVTVRSWMASREEPITRRQCAALCARLSVDLDTKVDDQVLARIQVPDGIDKKTDEPKTRPAKNLDEALGMGGCEKVKSVIALIHELNPAGYVTLEQSESFEAPRHRGDVSR